MNFTEDNISRLTEWVQHAPRIDILKLTIDGVDIDNLNRDTCQRCPSCFEIPRYPIIFPCGHLECHSCYVKDFKLRGLRRDTSFYTVCPNCRAEVSPDLVRTVREEIQLQHTSKAAQFYSTIRVRCNNMGCNLFTPYLELDQHELYQCPRREVECPAKFCPCAGTPDCMEAHTTTCPLHYIWCQDCYSKWPVCGYHHSCLKSLQARVLSNKNFISGLNHLSNLHKQPSGSVVLPEHEPFESPDDMALLKVRNLVRENRAQVLFGQASSIPEAAKADANAAAQEKLENDMARTPRPRQLRILQRQQHINQSNMQRVSQSSHVFHRRAAQQQVRPEPTNSSSEDQLTGALEMEQDD